MCGCCVLQRRWFLFICLGGAEPGLIVSAEAAEVWVARIGLQKALDIGL